MNKKGALSSFMVLYTLVLHAQITYYIDQKNGDDTKDGKTVSNAFKSIDSAAKIAGSGDVIEIIGQYTNPGYSPNYTYVSNHDPHLWHHENTIRISDLHGSASGYITLKPHDNTTILKGDGANIFRVQNSSYLKIEGFTIEGEVDRIPLSVANKLQFVYIDENKVQNATNPQAGEIQYRDRDCVSKCVADSVDEGEVYSDISKLSLIRPSYIDTRGMYLNNVHHIEITGNTIHHMPGGGLRVSECEDIKIVGNEIHNCARKSYSGTHALVVTKATSTRTSNDYRIYILKNKIHHNYNEQYSWAPSKTIITPHIDEGKGISLQRNETTDKVNWNHGRILIANNLCYFNGFSGVHSNDGHRIDIINNTCYVNSYTKSVWKKVTSSNGGNIGISAQGGTDISIINNIAVIDSGLSKSAISSNISAVNGLVVKDNIIYGTDLSGNTAVIQENANVVSVQVNSQMADPLFVDPLKFDFNLKPGSPAIDKGAGSNLPTEDYFGRMRDNMPDIGAIEYEKQKPDTVILAIDEFERKTMVMFPNPTSDFLYLTNIPIAPDDVVVYNAIGQNMNDHVRVYNERIDVSRLPQGLYMVKVGAFSGMVYKE